MRSNPRYRLTQLGIFVASGDSGYLLCLTSRFKDDMLTARLKISRLKGQLREKLIGRHATHVLCDSFNGKLLVPVADFTIGRSLAFDGEYDRAHVEKLFGLVGTDSRVLFVGAHIGSLVVPIAKRVREVVAVEANPFTFATLLMNLSLNDCNNVACFNVAASDEKATIEFLASKHNSGGSKIVPAHSKPEFFYDAPQKVQVPSARLDDLLPQFEPSLVVMDIEGAEVRALRGMPRLLQCCDTLMVEFLPNHVENIAGISCEEFIRLLPFKSVRLLDDPAEKNIVDRVRNNFYYGGADLICTH